MMGLGYPFELGDQRSVIAGPSRKGYSFDIHSAFCMSLVSTFGSMLFISSPTCFMNQLDFSIEFRDILSYLLA